MVAIYVALAIIMLLAVTAVAIDIGNGWQQQRNAQAVADSAALSAAQGLHDQAAQCSAWTPFVATTGCAYAQAFYYAFGSLSVPRPSTAAQCLNTANCYAETSDGKTVVVYTIWTGNVNWVHVKVCWSTPTFFAKVVGVDSLSPCGSATAQAVIVPPTRTTGCASNDLTSRINNPITPGQTTIVATYNAALPIDPTKIVFIGTDSSGTLVKLNPGAGGYTLTYGSGNTATLSYRFPAGLTSTASLFVTDTQGQSCGELAWSSCPVSTHDNFIETDGNGQGIADHGMAGTETNKPDADDTQSAAQLANSALIADADDTVTPGPGQTVGPGATLGAIYHDETNINYTKSVLFLNGVQVPSTLTQMPGGTGANAFIYDMSYQLPSSTPNGWNSAFLYFWDADVNQTGGDCSLTQWPFSFTAGNQNVNLVQ